MTEGICGTCGSPIVVRDGKALSVIDRSFIEERDRYRAALYQIAQGITPNGYVDEPTVLYAESQLVPQNDTETPNAA